MIRYRPIASAPITPVQPAPVVSSPTPDAPVVTPPTANQSTPYWGTQNTPGVKPLDQPAPQNQGPLGLWGSAPDKKTPAELAAEAADHTPIKVPTRTDLLDTLLTGGKGNSNAAYYGNTYDPNYKPDIGEQIVGSLGSATRSMGEALNRFGRQAVDAYNAAKNIVTGNYTSTDTVAGTEMVKKSQSDSLGVLTKFTVGAAEQAANIFSLNGIGAMTTVKAGVQATAEQVAKQAAKMTPELVANAPAITAALKPLTFVQKALDITFKLNKSAIEGGAMSGLYGALYGLQKYPEDWSKAMEDVPKDVAFGAISMPFLHALGMLGAWSIPKVLNATGNFIAKTPMLGNMIMPIKNVIDAQVANVLDKYGATELANKVRNIASLKETADSQTATEASKLVRAMVETGQMEVDPLTAKKWGADGKFNAPGGGGDEWAMHDATAIMQGQDVTLQDGTILMYSDPKIQKETIAANPILQGIDKQRVADFATGQTNGTIGLTEKIGGTERIIDPSKYLPHQVPQTPLSESNRIAFNIATTPEEKLAILEKNDPIASRSAEQAVNVDKTFSNKLDALQAHYDWLSYTEGDGLVKVKDNKMLQWLAQRDGTGKTPDEIAGILIKKKTRQDSMSITGKVSSIDFNRDLNLPIYDTNVARVSAKASLEAAGRNVRASVFGPQDENIHAIIKEISSLTEPGRSGGLEISQKFEKLVRAAFGTGAKGDEVHGFAKWVMALQNLKLTTSAPKILGEGFNGLIKSDSNSYLNGLASAFTDEGFQTAHDAGVLYTSYRKQANDFLTGGTSGKFGEAMDNYFKYTGITAASMFKKVAAANESEFYYTNALANLAKENGVKLADSSQGKVIQSLQKEFDQAATDEYTRLRKLQPKADAKELMQQAQDTVMGTTRTKKLNPEWGILADKSTVPTVAEMTAQADQGFNVLSSASSPVNTAGGINPASMAAPTEVLKTPVEPKLPKSLSSAKPTYNYGSKGFKLSFTSDIDKAAYIVGGKGKSKSHGKYLEFLQGVFPDKTKAALAAMGKDVRDTIKTMASSSDPGELKIGTITNKAVLSSAPPPVNTAGGINPASMAAPTEVLKNPDAQQWLETVTKKPSRYDALTAHTDQVAANKVALTDKIQNMEAVKSPDYWKLIDAGVNPGEALARGYLSPEEKALAAYRYVESSMANGDHMNMPYFASTPTGKVLMQFKSFGYVQSKLALTTIKNQIERGQYVKALTSFTYLTAVVPAGYAVINDIKSLLTGRNVPTTALDQYYASVGDANGWGMFSEFIHSLQGAYGSNVVDWAVGVTPNTAAQYLELAAKGIGIAKQAISGDKKAAAAGAKYGVSVAKKVASDVGGTAITNYLFPTKKTSADAPMIDILTGKTKKNFFTGKK